MQAILAIDQGTTSTRVIAFGADGALLAQAQKEHQQHYPKASWVEHAPEELWQNTLWTLRKVYAALKEKYTKEGIKVAAIGITNQRETVIAWHKKTGEALYNALVWQDRRTEDFCQNLKSAHKEVVQAKTGLPIDPYFSASKMHWLLQNVPAVQKAKQEGTLAFGTVESYLLYKLTGGAAYKTDSTNASRTLLFDIHKMAWSQELCTLFGVPTTALPEVLPNTADFGITFEGVLSERVPITAMVGDQHAALVGQGCLQKGMVKSTYGTGCFTLVNTGVEAYASKNGLLTTLGYHVAGQKPVYALEGSIFIAGAGVQWLRDQLVFFKNASKTEEIAQQKVYQKACLEEGLYFVPAFSGLGAPYWQGEARGALLGMTLKTDKAAITCAMLEAVAYQTYDLLQAMEKDLGAPLTEVLADGGMVQNKWLMQYISSIVGCPVKIPQIAETTAFGAALLAGVQAKVYTNLKEATKHWQEAHKFTPKIETTLREERLKGWHKAVQTVLFHTKED